MNNIEHNHNPIPYIRNLCRDLPESEIEQAEECFRAYVNLVRRVCIRLAKEQGSQTTIDETAPDGIA